MPENKKVKPKKVPVNKQTKHNEWVVDKLTEIVGILDEHQRMIDKIRKRMGI